MFMNQSPVDPRTLDPPGLALETGAPAWPSRHRAASETIWNSQVFCDPYFGIYLYIIYILYDSICQTCV